MVAQLPSFNLRPYRERVQMYAAPSPFLLPSHALRRAPQGRHAPRFRSSALWALASPPERRAVTITVTTAWGTQTTPPNPWDPSAQETIEMTVAGRPVRTEAQWHRVLRSYKRCKPGGAVPVRGVWRVARGDHALTVAGGEIMAPQGWTV